MAKRLSRKSRSWRLKRSSARRSTLDTLRRLYDYPEGQFILGEVREYLAQQWKGGRVLGHSTFHVEVNEPRFLTVAEIAEKAGVSFATVAKAIQEGVIAVTCP